MSTLVLDSLDRALAGVRGDTAARNAIVELGLFAGTASDDALDEATCDALVARLARGHGGLALELATALFVVGPRARESALLEEGIAVALVDLRGATRAGAMHVLGLEGDRVTERTITKAPHVSLGLLPLSVFHEARTPDVNAARAIASTAIGVARAAYETAHAYAQERVQFGRAIASFGAIEEKLDRARALLARVSITSVTEATSAAVEIAHDGLQIHGGYGYTREYTAERFYRDALELHRAAGAIDVPVPGVGVRKRAAGR